MRWPTRGWRMSEMMMTVIDPIAPPPRGLARDVAARVLRQWGPRIGLTWLGLLLVLAVFSPFLATSYPLLMKVGGRWSSPAIANLGAADVILLTGFWAAVVLWFLPM